MPVEHIVWIKFNDDISAERKQEHMDNLKSMKGKIPQIIDVKVGENFTDRSGGFTHGLSVTVTDRDALPDYIGHPYHVEVATPLKAEAELRALDFEF